MLKLLQKLHTGIYTHDMNGQGTLVGKYQVSNLHDTTN